MIEILDVTLRDGGYRTNFNFQDEEVKTTLTLLDKAGIDYIEIGYRNGSLHEIENIGKAGLCHKDYLQYCQNFIKQSKIAVMAYPKNIIQDDLSELQQYGVDLLRIGVVKNQLPAALPLINQAKHHGLTVSINLIHISNYTNYELDEAITTLIPYKPDMIYFADSNGCLLPERVRSIFTKYTIKNYDIPFGFHAHDNLGLAQANALAALNANVQLIDSSLAGMGKGTGNLKTEFFVAYLQAINNKKYDLNNILNAANYIRKQLKIGSEALKIEEFERGIYDPAITKIKNN